MTIKRALYGGSFNPPHIWHRQIVEWLAREFDEVVIVPCGHRTDKVVTSDMALHHRAVMCDLAFGGLPNVLIDFSDLENSEFSSNHELQLRHSGADVELWHVIGTDMWRGSESIIRRSWLEGLRIWDEFNWLVVARPNYELPEDAELPLSYRIETICDVVGSSTDIRDRLIKHQPVEDMLQPAVAAYIMRHGLYLGRPLNGVSILELSDIRPCLYVDQFNERAKAIAEQMSDLTVSLEDANVIIPLGGDGTMLRAVFEHWRLRLPFLGMNFGHAGFLMNCMSEKWQAAVGVMLDELKRTRFNCYQLPLLSVAWTDDKGMKQCSFGFNDVYVKAESPTVPVRMDVTARSHGREWSFSNAMGDGLVCATEAGSTGYAYQADAEPLPLSAEGKWLMKGICARSLPQISLDTGSEVVVRLGRESYRRAVLCADNRILGTVVELIVRLSNVGSAELAFLPGTDLTAKRIDLVLGR